MIYDIETQLKIIVLLILFGIFLIATYDIFYYVIDLLKPKTWIRLISEILFGALQLFIAYRYSYKICEGYVPIYFFLFFGLGILIYLKLLKKTLEKDLPYIMKILAFIFKWMVKLIVFLFYSREVVYAIKMIAKAVGKLTKKIWMKIAGLFKKIIRPKKGENSA
jgi:spore cortex biosynthesis protein YabQ